MADHQEERASFFREVLTEEETGIPGLTVFGHAADLRPILPTMAHQHRNRFEILLLKRGLRRLSASGAEYTLYPGQAFLVRPNEEHKSLDEQPSRGEIYWFQLDMSVRSGLFLGLSPRESDALYRILSGFEGRLLELPERLLRRFEEAFFLLSGEGLAPVEGHALFAGALCGLLSCQPSLELLTPDIDRAKQYILLHVKEVIDIDELLLASGLPLGEFREKFQSQIGCSPRDFINRCKIERASRMVACSSRSVADIAYAYHFSSAAVFKLLFKRQMGMSPGKYRRRHRRLSGRG